MRVSWKTYLKRILIAALIIALICGLIAGYRHFRGANGAAVKVYSVAEVSESDDYTSSDTMYGTVQADRTQSVYLSGTQTVKEVKVKQGQSVKKGDVLMTYDTSLQQLEVQKADLQIQKQQQDLKKYQSDLEKVNTYRPGVPVPKSRQVEIDSSGGDGGISNGDESMADDSADSMNAGSPITALQAGTESGAARLLTQLIGTEAASSVLAAEGSSQSGASKETTAAQEETTKAAETEKAKETSTESSKETSTETSTKATKKAEKESTKETTKESASSEAKAAETTAENRNYPKLAEGKGTASHPYVYHYTKECVFDQNFLSYLRQGSEKKSVTVTMLIVEGANEKKKDPGETVGSFTFTITTQADKENNTSYQVQMTQICIGEESYDLTPINEGKEVTKKETSAAESSAAESSAEESSPEETQEVVTEPADETTTAPETKPNNGGGDNGGGGGGGGDDESVTYTAAEIRQMKDTLEQNIRDLNLDIRVAQFNLKKKKQELGNSEVKAKFDGTITAVNDEETARNENSVFIRLSAGGGYYIRGSVSELKLDQMKVGQKMQITSYDTGETCTGEVTKISAFPESSSDNSGLMDSSGNTNVSSYPVTVFVKEGEASLQDGEYVEMAFLSDAGTGDKLYLMNSMFRTDGGSSYVYLRGKDGRLKKQSVKVGRSLGDGYTQILSGLTVDDYVAFPYGQDLKEGAKTEEGSVDDLYTYS